MRGRKAEAIYLEPLANKKVVPTLKFSPLIENLFTSLRYLPGVGPKSAQRMAFHLLQKNKEGALTISKTLSDAVQKIRNCNKCRILCEAELCNICQNSNNNRDESILCVVENPQDVIAIEQTGTYKGMYFVLLGHLSPVAGIGPKEIGVDVYKNRLACGTLKEIIMATNPTVEGEATAYYLADLAKPYNISITRITYGVPIGGELDHIDINTISRAITTRNEMLEEI